MTYAKGACVLHALRGLIGDEAWWKGIRRYVAAHQLKLVETEDFRKAMEAASGQDLKWFFDQWVFRAGHPELRVRWHYEDADKTVRVDVRQTQKTDDQTPLFRLPTTIEITLEGGTSRAVPVVIDGAAHQFVIPAETKPRMVLIDPKGWLIKELDFEKPEEENRFQLEHASCVLDRLVAARALAKAAQDHPEAARALERAWKREQALAARPEMVRLLANGAETFRAALLEAAKDPEARVRVAALEGLAKLRHDEAAEAILRAAWSNAQEAYGARRAALRGLAGWRVKDAEALLAAGLAMPAGKHTLAAAALELMLEAPGAKSRELAALYSRYGQPEALRVVAVGAFHRLAQDDPALQDILVALVDDPSQPVRFQTWDQVLELKVRKAYPALKARLDRETVGFGGFAQRRLRELIDALTEKGSRDGDATAAEPVRDMAELEARAAALEQEAKDLRSRIAAAKREAQASEPASRNTAAGTGSDH
jgi:aminopeptidase N